MNIVLIHGWGCDARHWQPLIQALPKGHEVTALELPGFGANAQHPWPDTEVLLRDLYTQLPQNCLLLGHSLGGMLAARLAARSQRETGGRGKVAALITIAANTSFVEKENWPGMAKKTFAQFAQSMRAQPEATWEKFCGLQARGDSAMRPLLKQLKQWQPQAINGAWLGALECLGNLDNRELIPELTLPALHLFGEKDALVPMAAAENLGGRAAVLHGCGHAPHISSPARVAEKILPLLERTQRREENPPLEKSAVARSFSRAAASYDTAAHLQRAVCRQLLNEAEKLPVPKRILDLGSGTGYGSELLRRRYPNAEILALDLAEGMLDYARRERPAADFHIAADAENLPLADASVDMIFSSLALQWCYRLPVLFGELQRVLAPAGRCLVATLGPGTLWELKQSWSSVDTAVHVNRFLPDTDWYDSAESKGLPGEIRSEERVLHFRDVRELMRELKTIGAHNVNREAGRGLMTRGKLLRLAKAYESFRGESGLPASYEVVYLNLAPVGAAAPTGGLI